MNRTDVSGCRSRTDCFPCWVEDEVPEGIWEGSSICRTFMQENGLTKIRDLKDYFLEQILEMLDKRNIQAVGWQDIVMNPDNTVNEHFKNSKVLNLLLEHYSGAGWG